MGWRHWETFTGLAVANGRKHNIECVIALSRCQNNFERNGQPWRSLQTAYQLVSLLELKTQPSCQLCLDSASAETRDYWGRSKGRGRSWEDRDRLSSRLRQEDRAERQIEGVERVSRVAECRADGSWYGRSSGQASAVPCRPPGATLNSHPNILHCFSQQLHKVNTPHPKL